jgi:hypothetical protein
MPSSAELYPLIHAWLQAMGITSHRTALASLAHVVTALLVGQSLRSTALMRALLSPVPVPARQRYKRLARAWTRRWLSPGWLTPRLVRAALALVAPDPPGWPTAGLTHLALDSVRCGRWEILTVGVVWHGRVLPVGWALLPYPWPKGRFTPLTCDLLRQVAAAWPSDRPAHLVADRGFPSRRLFETVAALGWGWTVRLRASLHVTVDGRLQPVRACLAQARLAGWTASAAAYGTGATAVAGTLVIGRGLVVLPWHQRDAGSLGHRARQQAQRQHDRHATRPRRAAPAGATDATDPWVILFTSHGHWRAAADSYRRRWATEGSYRDVQSGWDGRHGWDLEAVVGQLADRARVEHLIGLWALGALIQTWVGHQVGGRSAPTSVQAVVRQWTTTGRLSVWARGRLALTEPSGRLRPWIADTLTLGCQRLAAAPPPPIHGVPPATPIPPTTRAA